MLTSETSSTTAAAPRAAWRLGLGLVLLTAAAYGPLLPYAGGSEDLYVVGRAALDSPREFLTLFNWTDRVRTDAERQLLATGGIPENFLMADAPCEFRFFRPLAALALYGPMRLLGDRLPLLAALGAAHLLVNALLLAGCVRRRWGPPAALAAGAGYLLFTPNTAIFGFLASHSMFWWHTTALVTLGLLLRLPPSARPSTFGFVLAAGTVVGLGFREFAVIQPVATLAVLALLAPPSLTPARVRGAWVVQVGVLVGYAGLSRALGWGSCYAATTLLTRDLGLALRTQWRTAGAGFVALATNGSLLGLPAEGADRLAPVATGAAVAGLALLAWYRVTRPLAVALVAVLGLASDTLLGGRGLAAAGFLVPVAVARVLTWPGRLQGGRLAATVRRTSVRACQVAIGVAWVAAWIFWVWIARDPYALRIHRAAGEMAAAVRTVLEADPKAETIVLLAQDTGIQHLALAHWTRRALGWPADRPGPRLIVPFVVTSPVTIRWPDPWTVRIEPLDRRHVMDGPGAMANALVYTRGLPAAGWAAKVAPPFATQRFVSTERGAISVEIAFDREQAAPVFAAWTQGGRAGFHRIGEPWTARRPGA